jgi:alanyl-tRNA synthetase
MNAQDIRNKYLDFYKSKGHEIIPRAPLVLNGDPTTLFTGSGMQPMIPYLLGEPHPKGVRIADSQTCLRAQDVDEVGDNRHTTFFEMLGNWSLGDYFKQEQVPWMFEFLTEVVGLDPSRLYVTCYIGAPEYHIPKDTEAGEIWAKLFADKGLSNGQADIGSGAEGSKRGIKEGERIFYYDGSKNWWSRNGAPETTPVGDPCGPDSEMFFDFGTPHDTAFGEFCHPNCDCGRFVEIGNNVFMTYKKIDEKTFEPLAKPNIDHGSGLERIAAAANDDPDVFRISLLWPIIEKLQALSGKNYESHTESMRVIADHLRAATFLAVDGCTPSNKEQGYVMRRFIRRAIRRALELGIAQNFLEEVVPVIADMYVDDFPEVAENRGTIIEVLVKEERAFRQTLIKGERELTKIATRIYEENLDEMFPNGTSQLTPEQISVGVQKGSHTISGRDAFIMMDQNGYPFELTLEAIFRMGDMPPIDIERVREEYDLLMQEQRERSRTATKGTFKGGLEGSELIHLKYHTATHLLQSALRQIFGELVRQHGSNITTERLRFDFNLDHKMTSEEIAKVEELVNGWIAEDNPVKFTLYPTQEALDMGAIGPFGERYGDTVKVYQMGSDDHIVSLEICGGPHVDHTGQLGEDGKKFRILKEESSSAGIRRIKAVLI